MTKHKYATEPVATTGMPGGIPYIIGNEAAERFSFYGMRCILVIFMTRYLLDSSGESAPMSEQQATSYFHLFVSAVYFFPVVGALVSDALLGKYRTIMILSIVYCLGHLVLALDETRLGLAAGLTLIAIGAGGIKPCVSAHVGDQFGPLNQHRLDRVFSWFYFSINAGAFVSTLLIPWILDRHGPHVAFGLPGLLMMIATWAFWLGRRKFIHVPAAGLGFVRETLSGTGIRATVRFIGFILFVSMFWSLFDQTGSAWVLQAERMDRTLFGKELLSSQIQAVNPLFILLLIPAFAYVVYPVMGRFFTVTPLRKVGIGFFIAAASFCVPAWVEMRLAAGETPNIIWHVFAYILLTTAEIMVSITGLEFAYRQAPKTMKSFIMSIWLLSVSVGNLFTALVNMLIANEGGTSKLAGASYYWFFAGLMALVAVAFIFFARTYPEHNYIQGDEAPPPSGSGEPAPTTS